MNTRDACNVCLMCKWFKVSGIEDETISISQGECRRFPPQLVSVSVNVINNRFPLVRVNDWCGEYTQK